MLEVLKSLGIAVREYFMFLARSFSSISSSIPCCPDSFPMYVYLLPVSNMSKSLGYFNTYGVETYASYSYLSTCVGLCLVWCFLTFWDTSELAESSLCNCAKAQLDESEITYYEYWRSFISWNSSLLRGLFLSFANSKNKWHFWVNQRSITSIK